jgi:hypothetical protein
MWLCIFLNHVDRFWAVVVTSGFAVAERRSCMSNPRFREVRSEAATAIETGDLRSVYAGLVHEDGRHEYYFGNDTETTEELRENAAVHLGMVLRVLADRSESDLDELADLAVERAEAMDLR